MPTFYIDPEGGNDANNGSSFALRRKTFTGGVGFTPTPTAGDTIKFIASLDPVGMSVTGAFEEGNREVILSAPVTKNIYLEGAWTAVMGSITPSADASIEKQGVNCAKFVSTNVASTGLVAYYNLGSSQDFDAFQQLSFWFQVNQTTLSARFQLKLCTGTNGTSPAVGNSFQIPEFKGSASTWIPLTIDMGSAMATGIQSIGLFCDTVPPGAITWAIDNIFACKAPLHQDELHLNMMVGKGTGDEPYMSIKWVNSATSRIAIDGRPDDISHTNGEYPGATGTVTLYRRRPLNPPLTASSATAAYDIAWDGTSGAHITVSGGWNRTDMLSQAVGAMTYLAGRNGLGYGIQNNSRDYIDLSRFSCTQYTDGIYFHGTVAPLGCTIDVRDTSHCATGLNANACRASAITGVNCSFCSSYGAVIAGEANTATLTNLDNSSIAGLHVGTGSSNKITVTNLRRNGEAIVVDSGAVNNTVYVGGSVGPGNQGVGISGFNNNIFFKPGASIHNIGASASGRAIDFTGGYSNNNRVYDASISNHYATAAAVSWGAEANQNYLIRCSIDASIPFNTAGATAFFNGRVWSHGQDGDPNTHIAVTDGGKIESDDGVDRHTASGIAWKMSVTSANRSAMYPLIMPIAGPIYCRAGKVVTFKAWVKRNHAEITAMIRLRNGIIPGPLADVTATATAVDSYEQLTLTFTPSAAGNLYFEMLVWGGTTRAAWIDDLTISQAA